jgi:pimeloyl-ACP methyl ester carboxylesterase
VATYVLVHGAWSGGWMWRDVARMLRAAGHEAFAPTLTGLGERVHLARPDVDLDCHVRDVANVLRYERLERVVLVGYSYGGVVVTGVAEQEPLRIARLVYLDALVPFDGESAADLLGPTRTALFVRAAKHFGDGWRVPAPKDGPEGARFTDMPLQAGLQRLAVRNPTARGLPRTFVLFTAKPATDLLGPVLERMAARARRAGWDTRALAIAHGRGDDAEAVAQLLTDLR